MKLFPQIAKKFQKIPFNSGYSLVEIILAMAIIGGASIGLMKGVTYARAQLNSLHLKEQAFQELKNYTEYWKARIAAIPSNLPPQVGGFGDEIHLYTGHEDNINIAHLYRTIVKKSSGNTIAHYYELKTRIEWTDPSFGNDVEKEMGFLTYQLAFP